MSMNLEERNYWNDSRTQAVMRQKAFTVLDEGKGRGRIKLSEAFMDDELADEAGLPPDHDGIIECSIKYEVCDCCRGRGKVVNPSIDAGGLTREDFDEDPDFHEAYMNGDYDVKCPECDGLRVVPIASIHDEKIAKAVAEFAEAEIRYARELAHERAMGY